MPRTVPGRGAIVRIYPNDHAFDVAHSGEGPPVLVNGMLYFPDGATRTEGTALNTYSEPPPAPKEAAVARLTYWTARTKKEEDCFREWKAGADQLTQFNLDFLLAAAGVVSEREARVLGEMVRGGQSRLDDVIARYLTNQRTNVTDCRRSLAAARTAVYGTPAEQEAARRNETAARRRPTRRWDFLSIDGDTDDEDDQ